MQSNLIESRANYSFRLDGDNEIDALLLSNMISDMAELTKLAASVEDPEAYLKMNVTAFSSGSFQIDFSTVLSTAETILVPATAAAGFALLVVNIVKGMFDIKKLQKGTKPKSVSELPDNKIEIENEDGDKVIVPKASSIVLYNIRADQLTMNISNYAQSHNPNGGFTIATPEGDLVCTSEDVNNISKSLPIEEAANNQRYTASAELPIKTVDFMGKSAWQFILDDRTITATMSDEDWLRKVHSGAIQIRAGDSLEVTLEIFVDLDALGLQIEKSRKYTVVKVHGGIIRKSEQLHMH